MIYFFSYGDDKYKNSKQRIKKEAINFGFDRVDIYGREDITQDFIDKTQPYINHPRGGGYWLWKPFFLKKTFDMMNHGDYCVYADAGCTINSFGRERFKYYLSLLDNSESGVFRFKFGSTSEYVFTSQKVFEFFNKIDDQEFQSTSHLMATILIFKKNENSENFVNKYFEITINSPEIFSDTFNDYKRIDEFSDHRHDQSVSSCLVKLVVGNAVIIQDETYASDMNGWQSLFYEKKIPFLATRIRN